MSATGCESRCHFKCGGYFILQVFPFKTESSIFTLGLNTTGYTQTAVENMDLVVK